MSEEGRSRLMYYKAEIATVFEICRMKLLN
nr:MAG TPA_asm: hypothetical protein [Caudoviricetes sp.]